MFAILSDIHSNIEALSTVLADIEKRGIKTIYCLGDVIGYGPNPRECLDLIIEKAEWCVLGNHDYAVFYEPTNFNYGAEQASFWTREVLEMDGPGPQSDRRWRFLGELPMRHSMKVQLGPTKATMDFVHASPRRPINEYIFPEDVFTNPQKVMANFERLDRRICFVGHTHQPVAFRRRGGATTARPAHAGTTLRLGRERLLLNPGSVGQPRDGNPLASYMILDTTALTATWHRVGYDIGATQAAIMAAGLPRFLAQRLALGV